MGLYSLVLTLSVLIAACSNGEDQDGASVDDRTAELVSEVQDEASADDQTPETDGDRENSTSVEAGSAESDPESSAPPVTSPLPPDVSTPPTALYDPPLALEDLEGRPAADAVAWAEAQGFTEVAVVGPDDGITPKLDPARLVILVDEEGIVVQAVQG